MDARNIRPTKCVCVLWIFSHGMDRASVCFLLRLSAVAVQKLANQIMPESQGGGIEKINNPVILCNVEQLLGETTQCIFKMS